jgi:hypothetical protein
LMTGKARFPRNAQAAPICGKSNRISSFAALIAFSMATVILAQGISAPFVKDAEPQAAEWIQDVASGHEILLPHDYYGELARKPPMFYWVAGAISAATGGRVDEFRARVVSVVAGASIAVAVLIWTATFLDLTTGWLAFLFLLGSCAFTSRGTLALEDMTLVAFVFAAWCLLYPTIEEGPSGRKIAAVSAALGLGILTKGPVAIVLPAFAASIYLQLTHRSIAIQIRQRWPWAVFAISVAIALPWYIPALLSHGGELASIIFQENAGHFLPTGAGGTRDAARPFYYVAMKTLGGTIPLNFLLPALVVTLIRGDFVCEARKPLMFQLSFLLAVVIFFSIARAKRDDYVLPGIPSLAILLGALFTSLRDAHITRRLRDLAAIAGAAIVFAGLATKRMGVSALHSVLASRINPIDRTQAELFVRYDLGAISLIFIATAFAVVGCAILIVSGTRRKHPARTAGGLGSLSLLGVLMFTAVLRPEMSRERTLKNAATDINRIAPDATVYVVNQNEELSFYLGRVAPLIIGPHSAIRPVDQPAYLFAYQRELRRLEAPLRERCKFIRQWDRLGRAGPPALFQLQP